MSTDNKQFDLHTAGIGYLNRIREVKLRKGSPFWACSINALRGSGAEIEYTRFDLIVRGSEALHRILTLRSHVERKQKVLVTFKIGDIYPDMFTYESGERKGQSGVAIKGRLLQIGFSSIDGVPVDWGEVSLQNEFA